MRTTGISDPIHIISLAESLLETGYLKSNSPDIDDLLEQIAMAALEIGGQEELSSICIQRLESRFPKSERVSLLHGMAFESRGEMSSARAHYEDILEKDESRIVSLVSLGSDGVEC